jgi:hypothetical protein
VTLETLPVFLTLLPKQELDLLNDSVVDFELDDCNYHTYGTREITIVEGNQNIWECEEA